MSCTLVPTPMRLVEPIRTATFPARAAANSSALALSVLASCMNRTVRGSMPYSASLPRR